MGQAANAGLREYVEQFRLNTFAETGTGHGVSVRDAMAIPALEAIHSIEIDWDTWCRNDAEFHAARPRVKLYQGDSRTLLPVLATHLPPNSRVFWYLDAHFPGSANGVPMLPLAIPADDAVPIEAELVELHRTRGSELARDVIVIDDRCLWDADAYEASTGDLPDFREQLRSGDRLNALLDRLLHETHDIVRTTVDMGYIVCLPKRIQPTA